MALFDTLVEADGASHALWGLLPGRVTMQKRLAALGPQQLAVGGDLLRGHTFHYSLCDTPLPAVGRTARPGTSPGTGEAVYVQGAIRASYFHAWFAASPAATARLFDPAPLALAHG
jgi:cobyrinic acid a,c-diamide synthase